MTQVGWLSLVLALVPITASAEDWASSDRNLIVVAEPAAASAALEAPSDQALVLRYRVVEILAGEIADDELIVRHLSLTADDRARIQAGERVILLASEDPEQPGRHVASSPLLATDAAIDAFRAWSPRPAASPLPPGPADASPAGPLADPTRARIVAPDPTRPDRAPGVAAPPMPAPRALGPPLSQRVDLPAPRSAPPPVPLPPR